MTFRKRYFHMAPRDLVYLKFILEAHEGLATLSTADKMKGIIEIMHEDVVTPEINCLLSSLGDEISLVEIESLHQEQSFD